MIINETINPKKISPQTIDLRGQFMVSYHLQICNLCWLEFECYTYV
jgi:hypothetical protein